MPLPRRPLKHVRSAIMKLLRCFPAVQRRRVAERDARLGRDLDRLALMAERRPELGIQITCTGRTDGAGGQALSVISALAFADNHNCRYVHSPFRWIAHIEGDSAAWTRRWEEFFGFGHGEAPLPRDAEIVPIRRFVRLVRRDPGYRSDPRTIVQSHGFGYREFSARDISRLTPKLRAKYYSSDKSAIPVHRKDGAINVAVHVRRGDVTEGFFRYMPDAPILAAIAQLRAILEQTGRAAIFNIFSEGSPDQFAPYSEAGCVLHLSTDTFETFHNLVAADILVPAHSAFSRTAALLSEGVIVAPSADWTFQEGCLKPTPDGTLDQARIIALLASMDGST
jgi:hypothetical protein